MPRDPLNVGDMTSEDSRITALEELAAHQGRVIEELSGELSEQWKVIDQMRKKLDRLTERLLDLEEAALEAPAITRPPHY
jgi:SlyX protein